MIRVEYLLVLRDWGTDHERAGEISAVAFEARDYVDYDQVASVYLLVGRRAVQPSRADSGVYENGCCDSIPACLSHGIFDLGADLVFRNSRLEPLRCCLHTDRGDLRRLAHQLDFRLESFNGKLRDELLDRELFYTLLEVRVLTERYRQTYNRIRPHSSLGYRPPAPETVLPAVPLPVLAALT